MNCEDNKKFDFSYNGQVVSFDCKSLHCYNVSNSDRFCELCQVFYAANKTVGHLSPRGPDKASDSRCAPLNDRTPITLLRTNFFPSPSGEG